MDLARVLEVTSVELLGIEPQREKIPTRKARMRKQLQRVEKLHTAGQRAVLKFVDALVESRAISRLLTKKSAFNDTSQRDRVPALVVQVFNSAGREGCATSFGPSQQSPG